MLPKIYKWNFVLFALLILLSQSLQAQENTRITPCQYLDFEDRIHLSLGSFMVSAPSVEQYWGEQMTQLLRHALLESNCFNVYRNTSSNQSGQNHFFIDGELLVFSKSIPNQRTTIKWLVQLRKKEQGSIIWQELIEAEESGFLPLGASPERLFGIDLSNQLLTPGDLYTLEQSISSGVQRIQEKLQEEESNIVDKADRQFLRLMVLPDLPNLIDILSAMNQTETKAALRSVSKELERNGYLVIDLPELQKISKEKYSVRDEPLQKAFDILLANAPADIIIYVDHRVDSIGSKKQVNLFLTAKDRYTAQRYASTPLLQSTERHWPSLYQPTQEALNKEQGLDQFVVDLDLQITQLLKKGRRIEWQIESGNEVDWPLDKNLNEDQTLVNLVMDWIRLKTVDQQIQESNFSSTFLQLRGVFAIRDEQGQNYSPLDYGLDLQAHVKWVLDTHRHTYKSIDLKVIGSRVHLTIH